MPHSNDYMDYIEEVAISDVKTLREKYKYYGRSCLKRGGVGLFMMFSRKWDRLEHCLENPDDKVTKYDILESIKVDSREETLLETIRDLRAYLIIAEAEAMAKGYIKDEEQLPLFEGETECSSIQVRTLDPAKFPLRNGTNAS